MRPRVWEGLWLVLVMMIAAAPLILLATMGPPPPGPAPRPIALNELALAVKQATIASIDMSGPHGIATDRSGNTFSFQLQPATDALRTLSALGVSADDLSNVDYTVNDANSIDAWWQAFMTMLPSIFMGLWLVIALRAGSDVNRQLFSLTSHRAKRFQGGPCNVRFADVAGVEEAKYELREIVEFLATPDRFLSVGARCPRGVLLTGPPGTGKTLLARAVAGEAGVPFFSIAGSEFVEIIAGVGASRVRDLFEQAERSAPCIIFVDEIDALARHRGAGVGATNDEREQALNQLLVAMDGFDSSTNVVVIAATNRADILDPALLRPGRFDRRVVVASPDLAGRRAILEVHARGKPLDADTDLGIVARLTEGLSGADLANVMNESAILAARRQKQSIGMPEIDEAVDRAVAGPEAPSQLLAARDKERRAYHEAGHALTMHCLEHHPPVHKLSIVPRARFAGYTRCLEADHRVFVTRNELHARLTAALAGQVAEQLVLGQRASGAENDIDTATHIARSMVEQYGMSARIGLVALATAGELPVGGRSYSEATAEAIDTEIRSLIDEGYQQAVGILTEHRESLERLALALIQDETLEGAALERCWSAGQHSADVRERAAAGRLEVLP
jgi:cell division protease FtsH